MIQTADAHLWRVYRFADVGCWCCVYVAIYRRPNNSLYVAGDSYRGKFTAMYRERGQGRAGL